MAPERRPGSDRGRPAIDWEQAFVHYAQLPASERSYQAVADEYGVSVRTVEKHGLNDGWKQRLADVHAEAAAAANAHLAEERAAKVADVEKLIDASLVSYAQQLQRGSVRVAPVDLLRLFELRQELWDEDAQTSAAQHPEQTLADEQAQADHRLQVVRALYEAGAFERLRDLVDPPHPGNDEDEAA